MAKYSKLICICALVLSIIAAVYFTYASFSTKTLFIGISLPLSGKQAKDGQEFLDGINLIVTQLNAEATNKKYKIKLLVRDDQNNPQTAKSIAEEFVKVENLIAVIGPYYASTLENGAEEVYEKHNTIVMMPYEGNTKASTKDSHIFYLNYSATHGAEHMAVVLKEHLQKDQLLVIHNTDAFGETSKNAFIDKANRLGLQTYKTIFYDHNKATPEDLIDTNLTDVDKEKIGAVVVFSHKSSGISIIKQLRRFGIDAPIFGTHTFTSHRYLEELTDAESHNVYAISPFLYELSNENANDYKEAFLKKYAYLPGTSIPLAVDAVLLLNDALQKIDLQKTYDTLAIRDSIKKQLQCMNWQTATQGVSGNLYFNQRNNIERDVFLSYIKDGRFKTAFNQLLIPRETYDLNQLPERVAHGYMKIIDNKPYHLVDVVFVGVDFVKINDVDPKTMLFEAELFVWFKWTNPNIDTNELEFINIMQNKKHELLKENLNAPVKYRSYKDKTSFFMPFDLTKFPFDYQYLPVYIAHKNKNSTHIMLATDIRHMDDTPVTNITPPEWNFKEMKNSSILYRFTSTFGDPDYRLGTGYKSKIYFSTLKANIVVKRKLLPYIFNLFLPLVVIIIISMLVLKIPVDQFVLRTNTTSAAIMSILLYYLAQKASLPKVGYMMKADYYFILLFVFILCLQAFNILINSKLVSSNKTTAEILNRKFSIYFIVATVIFYTSISILL